MTTTNVGAHPRTVAAATAFPAPTRAGYADLMPDSQRRARVDAWRYTWTNIGVGIAGGVGGINAIACAAFALMAACWLPAAARGDVSTGKTGYRQAFADSRLVLLFGSSLARLLREGSIDVFLGDTAIARFVEFIAAGKEFGFDSWHADSPAVRVPMVTSARIPTFAGI